jgi:hypothetical protein
MDCGAFRFFSTDLNKLLMFGDFRPSSSSPMIPPQLAPA